MAIWQFSLHLIPRKGIDRKNEGSEAEWTWENHFVTKDSLDALSSYLQPVSSWSEDVKQYGLSSGTCVELFYNKNVLNSIRIRLDLRNITCEILDSICKFAKTNDSLMLTNDGVSIEPEKNDLIKEIKKSKAYSFVKDPNRFLEELVKNGS